MTLDQTIQASWQELKEHAYGTIDKFQGRHLFLRGKCPPSTPNEKFGAYFGGTEYVELEEFMQSYFGKLQYNSTYVLHKKRSTAQSVLIIYGHLATRDEMRRQGYHCITIDGASTPLQQTFQYFKEQSTTNKKQPIERMNEFSEVVFNWSADTTQEQRYGLGHIPALNDICKRVYLLETDHDYSLLEKLNVKFRGNNNVQKIELP